LILVLILTIALLAFAQVAPICTQNSDCNDYATLDDKVCEVDATDPLLNKCTTRTGLDFKTTTVDSKGRCKDSFNHGTGNTQICGAFSNLGCTIETADTAYFKCIDSVYDNTEKKCKAPTVVATYVGEGARCDPRFNKLVMCGDNLQCFNNVCRAKLNDGDNCWADGGALQCKNGLVCDGDFCRPERVRWDGQSCKSSLACRSEKCSNTCLETRTIPCFSNTECAVGGSTEVCYKTSGAIRGSCTQSVIGSKLRQAVCKRDSLQKITDAVASQEACVKTYVEEICAINCKRRPDLRFLTPANTLEKSSFLYNCQTLTRTPLPDNTCTIKEFITGCPAIPIAGAMVNGLSVLLFAIIALIFA
jgi:hypothetical protein